MADQQTSPDTTQAPLALVEQPAPKASWRANLRNKELWKERIYDTVVWYLASFIVIYIITQMSPGRVILVTTPSIQTGVYWLDMQAVSYNRGDYTSFEFRPTQAWMQERYGSQHRTHTKQVAGIVGDVVKVDANQNVEICIPQDSGYTCHQSGVVMQADTKGRPLYGFLQPGQSYAIKPGEVWVMGTHRESLDSRYHGPVSIGELNGKASLLLPW